MGRHIVWPLIGMAQIGHRRMIRWWHQAVEKRMQIDLNFRVSVFLNQQGTGCVPCKQGQQAIRERLNPQAYRYGELIKPRPPRLDREFSLHRRSDSIDSAVAATICTLHRHAVSRFQAH